MDKDTPVLAGFKNKLHAEIMKHEDSSCMKPGCSWLSLRNFNSEIAIRIMNPNYIL